MSEIPLIRLDQNTSGMNCRVGMVWNRIGNSFSKLVILWHIWGISRRDIVEERFGRMRMNVNECRKKRCQNLVNWNYCGITKLGCIRKSKPDTVVSETNLMPRWLIECPIVTQNRLEAKWRDNPSPPFVFYNTLKHGVNGDTATGHLVQTPTFDTGFFP